MSDLRRAGAGCRDLTGSALSAVVDPARYALAVDRSAELARMQAQAQRRRSMLVFGPEAVGKSWLLERFLRTQPLALHVARVGSPREVLMGLAERLRHLRKPGISVPPLDSLTTRSLKGVVERALERYPLLLVLDHLQGPSRVVSGVIKDLNCFDRTPVFFVARTPHMEDIGGLQPVCAGKQERLELRVFPAPVALEFARREAARANLRAGNLHQLLRSLVLWTNGNPGSIVQMIRMARMSRYYAGDQIKSHVLYLDYRMGRRE